MSQPSRREFLLQATITLAGAGVAFHWPRRALASPSADQPLYAFPVLGDIHYDLMAHHDMDWVHREKPHDIRQIEGYVEASTRFTPRFLRSVAAMMREQKAPVPFVIQVGDFVEGLCGSFDLQAKQFEDAIGAVEGVGFGVPFLITKGNHDITGPGAPEAYDRVLLPWLSKQQDRGLDQASYIVKHDEDLFVYYDCYRGNVDWVEKALSENPARHVFFIVHQPVVPYNARATWTCFRADTEAEPRARLLSLLGQYQAIVLSGHLHKFCLLVRDTDAGPFVELGTLSVIRGEHEKIRDELNGVSAFGPDLVNLEPQHSPGTVDLRRQILADESAYIRHYEYANAAAFAMIKVYVDRVEADIYAGLEQQPWKSRDLEAVRAQAAEV